MEGWCAGSSHLETAKSNLDWCFDKLWQQELLRAPMCLFNNGCQHFFCKHYCILKAWWLQLSGLKLQIQILAQELILYKKNSPVCGTRRNTSFLCYQGGGCWLGLLLRTWKSNLLMPSLGVEEIQK